MVQSMSAGYAFSSVIIPQPSSDKTSTLCISCYNTHNHSLDPTSSVKQTDNNLIMDSFLFPSLITNITSPDHQTESTAGLSLYKIKIQPHFLYVGVCHPLPVPASLLTIFHIFSTFIILHSQYSSFPVLPCAPELPDKRVLWL